MCGFSGVIGTFLNDAMPAGFGAMTRDSFLKHAYRLKHRGDTETRSLFTDTHWLCHHRLAFQDVHLAQQPMYSACGEFVIVFNGEVYNHMELRKRYRELHDYPFRTRSDTETLIAAFTRLGTEFFTELDGEYAFVIIETAAKSLVAHRCPAGVKPLFIASSSLQTEDFAEFQPEYPVQLSELGFASEVKGLNLKLAWDREGLLRQYVGLYEQIRTPYAHVIHLPPGGILSLRRSANLNQQQQYSWTGKLSTHSRSLRSLYEHSPVPPEVLLDTLRASVADRLVSDVPLGVYLSSGIDSRTIATLLAEQQQASFSRESFTVGFHQQGYDEASESVAFAKAIGFTPHVLYVTDAMLEYSYPHAVQTSENVQPYTNGAAKWWLSRMTREHLQGVLTGDGADELLCGYPSYRYIKNWMYIMRARSGDLAKLAEIPLGSLPRDRLYQRIFADEIKNPWETGSSAAGTGLDFIDSAAIWGVFHPLYHQIHAITTLLLGNEAEAWLAAQGASIRSWFIGPDKLSDSAALLEPKLALRFWQNYFFRTHLPVQVLNWVGDRMEMANVLEGRTPFLSRRMLNLIQHIPDNQLVHGLQDKFILRQATQAIMAQKYPKQPKKQFGAPFLQLDKLLDKFQVAAAFAAVNLDESLPDKWLKQQNQMQSDNITQQQIHNQVNLKQCLQTAASMAINHQSLINNQMQARDLAFEAQMLDRGS